MYAANSLNTNLIRIFRVFFLFFLHENVALRGDSQLNATAHYGSELSNLQLEMVYIRSTNSSKRYLKRREWSKKLGISRRLNMDRQEINLISSVNNSPTRRRVSQNRFYVVFGELKIPGRSSAAAGQRGTSPTKVRERAGRPGLQPSAAPRREEERSGAQRSHAAPAAPLGPAPPLTPPGPTEGPEPPGEGGGRDALPSGRAHLERGRPGAGLRPPSPRRPHPGAPRGPRPPPASAEEKAAGNFSPGTRGPAALLTRPCPCPRPYPPAPSAPAAALRRSPSRGESGRAARRAERLQRRPPGEGGGFPLPPTAAASRREAPRAGRGAPEGGGGGRGSRRLGCEPPAPARPGPAQAASGTRGRGGAGRPAARCGSRPGGGERGASRAALRASGRGYGRRA